MIFWRILSLTEGSFLWMRKNFPTLYAYLDFFCLLMAMVVRFGSGNNTAANLSECKRPSAALVLYEFEGCPFCKKVRETLSVLDLDYIVYPCPRVTLKGYGIVGDSRYRPVVEKRGEQLKFPYLEDSNTGVKRYESDDIIRYLWSQYGQRAIAPMNYRLAHYAPLQTITLWTAALLRPLMDMGMLRIASRKPEKLLELWGFENSPFVKRVRETLSSLEIAYVMHIIPYGSEVKREQFRKEHLLEISSFRQAFGKIKVPYLRDPNTDVSLFESNKIVSYLKDTYQTGSYPTESWKDYLSRDQITTQKNEK
ncbi:glutathione s-transferase, n-terminal domain containing protein [Cardiosporidium cionae]|uniref:Glutathione s-transferase, n-terminal domain containing protein n=1 Tax=Cardiosporidium cionae TaxID=476202 RepID=A0ABQ7J9S3_9APIC|nr:glutathione s-transferase, n-terminal domain containing protein [Cardiosporidium cionae]|eukprot:KAF8820753.1 glutathione s-transferase, n-terminal domain containing protein [Cardiosporidium cionae]